MNVANRVVMSMNTEASPSSFPGHILSVCINNCSVRAHDVGSRDVEDEMHAPPSVTKCPCSWICSQILTVEEQADSFCVFRGDITSMVKTIQRAVDETVFYVTSNGYFGLGPSGLLENDEIHLIGGSKVPLVFRRKASQDVTNPIHSFIGECYVHGIMYGEALDLPQFSVDLITIH